MTNIAEVGQTIVFRKQIKGIVEKVYENSVIVSITENKTDLIFAGGITVVNHKNYQIIGNVKLA